MKKIFDIIRHPTSLDVIVNTVGNYINVFFTAFFAWILTRILDPSQYGNLSVLLSISYLLASVLDFGTTATIYSYLPIHLKNRAEDEGKALYRFIKSTFYYQSIFAIIVIAILLVTFPYLDKVFFKTNSSRIDLYLTTISVMLFIWQNFISNMLFAAKKFIHANFYNNAANVLKTIIILMMMATDTVTIGSVIFVFGIVGPAIFFLLLVMQKKDLLFVIAKSEVSREEFKFRYTLTYFLASQFYNFALRMDLFLLSFFQMQLEKGYYGLAQKIILTIITTIVSITQVVSPGFTHIQSKKTARQHFRSAVLYLLIPTAVFIALFFTPRIMFEWIFTADFGPTAEASHALALAFMLSAIGSVPMLFLLYTAKKPMPILISNIVFFAIVTLGSYLTIPNMGMFGPPIAIGIAFVVAIGYQSVAAWLEYEKLPEV